MWRWRLPGCGISAIEREWKRRIAEPFDCRSVEGKAKRAKGEDLVTGSAIQRFIAIAKNNFRPNQEPRLLRLTEARSGSAGLRPAACPIGCQSEMNSGNRSNSRPASARGMGFNHGVSLSWNSAGGSGAHSLIIGSHRSIRYSCAAHAMSRTTSHQGSCTIR